MEQRDAPCNRTLTMFRTFRVTRTVYVLLRLQLFAATNPASAGMQARPARQRGLPTGYDDLDLQSLGFQIVFRRYEAQPRPNFGK
jgi:hypothetical protein